MSAIDIHRAGRVALATTHVLFAKLVELLALLQLWKQRLREREELRRYMAMDYTHRRDAGISRSDAEREIAKPFWRA